MRPVDKGSHPEKNGKQVEFNSYQDAAPYLKERLGRFCSYCERKIPTNLVVEHVMPKSLAPELKKNWDNFLLAYTNCNSSKGKKEVQVDDPLWPDRDDTFSVFIYEPSGAIHLADGLDPLQHKKAAALLELVGLDKSPEATSDADYRHKDRLEQWGKAKIAFDLLSRVQPSMQQTIRKYTITQLNEGYSIWATVFRSDPVILDALAKKFPATKRY